MSKIVKWQVRFTKKAEKTLIKLDNSIQIKIINFIKTYIIDNEDPKILGKPLVGNLNKFWRYRIGDYRLICAFINNEAIVLVVEIGHRKKIYH